MKFNLEKLTINPNILSEIVSIKAEIISNDTIQDLRDTQPRDDTTKEKASYVYKSSGKVSWIKDSISSADHWKLNRVTKSKFGGGVRCSIVNKNPAVISLALGFIFSPLNINANPVERTSDKKYSEQDPQGKYALNSMKRAFQKNGIKYIKVNK